MGMKKHFQPTEYEAAIDGLYYVTIRRNAMVVSGDGETWSGTVWDLHRYIAHHYGPETQLCSLFGRTLDECIKQAERFIEARRKAWKP